MEYERFWSKVDRSGGPDACWPWTTAGRVIDGEYGKFRLRGAHRVSWELANGPIPDGLCVLHRCDNPPCVRPDHLWIGTKKDNIRDAMSKGRNVPPPVMRGIDHPARYRGVTTIGSRNSQSKLTEAVIPEIRTRVASGESRRSIARSLGVHHSVISGIVRGTKWRHVA